MYKLIFIAEDVHAYIMIKPITTLTHATNFVSFYHYFLTTYEST